MKKLTDGDIRKALAQLRMAKKRQKEVKYYKMEIKNWPLFFKFLKAGRLKQDRPGGAWDLIE